MSLTTNDIVIILVVTGFVVCGLFYSQISEAVTPNFIIKTSNGSLITLQKQTIPFVGFNGLKVTNNSTSILFNNTQIESSGILTRIQYQGLDNYAYFSDQLFVKGSYNTDVKNSEPFNGIITFTDMIPIANTLTQPVTFTLYINDKNTTQMVTINPGQTTISMLSINHSFQKGDRIYWVAYSNDHTGDILIMNARVLINYQG